MTDVWNREVETPYEVKSIIGLGSMGPRFAAYLDVVDMMVAYFGRGKSSRSTSSGGGFSNSSENRTGRVPSIFSFTGVFVFLIIIPSSACASSGYRLFLSYIHQHLLLCTGDFLQNFISKWEFRQITDTEIRPGYHMGENIERGGICRAGKANSLHRVAGRAEHGQLILALRAHTVGHDCCDTGLLAPNRGLVAFSQHVEIGGVA